MKKLMTALAGLAVVAIASSVSAKLPPLSDEAKAKAEKTKEKTAWSDKVAAYQLCLSQDKVAAYYRKNKGAEAKPTPTQAAAPAAPAAGAPPAAAPAPATIPPCQDPGPYVAGAKATATVGVADSKPVPAAGKPAAPSEAKK